MRTLPSIDALIEEAHEFKRRRHASRTLFKAGKEATIVAKNTSMPSQTAAADSPSISR